MVIDKLNQPAVVGSSAAIQLPESGFDATRNDISISHRVDPVYKTYATASLEPNGTVEIVYPIEGQTVIAGESVTISVQGTGDTNNAAVFGFFGSTGFSDIVELPWQTDVNISPNSIGTSAEIMVIGLDEYMNRIDHTEVNLVLDSNIVLEEIFFSFGNEWSFDFRQFPGQPNVFQLYPLGRFSDGSEHPLSILGDSVYSSSNEAVATVDPNGLMTIHSEGTTDVNVTNSAKSAALSIEVLESGLFYIEINHGLAYGAGGTDDLKYLFAIELETDEQITAIDFVTPDGNTYEIPSINGYDDVNRVGTFYEFDQDSGRYCWGYEAEFDDANGLQKYGDGLYTVIVEYDDGITHETPTWFGIPDTNNPIGQPAQKPTQTFPKHRTSAASPITFTWETCTDPNTSIITLDLLNNSTDHELEIDINNVNLISHGPLDLNDGYWESELSFGQWYTVVDNGEGVEIEIGKYSECDYEFAVGVPWITYEVWGGNTDYTTEPNSWEYYYNIDKHDYVKLGESGGQTTTFLGNYNFYVIAARAEFLLDSIKGLTGDYYNGALWTGGTSDWENISGATDGQFASVGWHGTEYTFRGFVGFSNPGSWTGLTVITDRLCGDFEPDGDVDFHDFAKFAFRWLNTDCGQCDGADLVSSGSVDWEDLLKFTENWLVGATP